MEKHYRAEDVQHFNPYSELPVLKDLTDKHQVLSMISELSKAYEETKQKVSSKHKSNTSLDLFGANIAEEIINDIQNFEEERRNQQMKISFGSGKISDASTSTGGRSSMLYVNII